MSAKGVKQTDCCHKNPDHSGELNRLQRIKGQLEGIARMIEANRYCPDILVQTRAATAAIRSLEASVLEKHLRSCVQEAFESQDSVEKDEKLEELIEIFKKRMQA